MQQQQLTRHSRQLQCSIRPCQRGCPGVCGPPCVVSPLRQHHTLHIYMLRSCALYAARVLLAHASQLPGASAACLHVSHPQALGVLGFFLIAGTFAGHSG